MHLSRSDSGDLKSDQLEPTREKSSQMPEWKFKDFIDNCSLKRIKYPVWKRITKSC